MPHWSYSHNVLPPLRWSNIFFVVEKHKFPLIFSSLANRSCFAGFINFGRKQETQGASRGIKIPNEMDTGTNLGNDTLWAHHWVNFGFDRPKTKFPPLSRVFGVFHFFWGQWVWGFLGVQSKLENISGFENILVL